MLTYNLKINSTIMAPLARFMDYLNFKYIDQDFPHPFVWENTQI